MTKMHSETLIQQWRQEEQEPFTGWDFSHLEGRMLEEQPSWSYEEQAAELMADVISMLDMGTGGGEALLELRPHWPKKVVVTEDYPPNFALVTKRLTPLGVRVEDVNLTESGPLPFANGEFELVLNRHSAFNPREVARILTPGGTFFSQQIHGLWAQDLLAIFGAEPQWPQATPQYYIPKLYDAGFEMTMMREWSGRLTFTDVGAIVYYLKVVPWLVPDFSVERYHRQLLSLQQRLENDGPLTFQARKYIFKGVKS